MICRIQRDMAWDAKLQGQMKQKFTMDKTIPWERLVKIIIANAQEKTEQCISSPAALQVDNMPSCCGSSVVGPDSDLHPTGSFVRAQVICDNSVKTLVWTFASNFQVFSTQWRLTIGVDFYQAGGLISVLPTNEVDLNNLYPPSKGDRLRNSSYL